MQISKYILFTFIWVQLPIAAMENFKNGKQEIAITTEKRSTAVNDLGIGIYDWKADRTAIVNAINDSDSASFKNVFKKMAMYWAQQGEFLFLEDNPSLGTTKQMIVLPSEKKLVQAIERFEFRAKNICQYCEEKYLESQLDMELKKIKDAQVILDSVRDFKKKIEA